MSVRQWTRFREEISWTLQTFDSREESAIYVSKKHMAPANLML